MSVQTTDYIGITPGALSAAFASDDLKNDCHPGVKVVLRTTVFGSGVTLTIQAKDLVSGKYATLLAGAEVVTNTTNVYTVYPGLTADPNVTASAVLPDLWRVSVAATGLAITAAVSLTKTFTVAGNQTALLLAAATMRVTGSTGNDGVYTIVSSTFVVDHTDIVVVQAVPDETADGTIVSAATYTVGCHLLV